MAMILGPVLYASGASRRGDTTLRDFLTTVLKSLPPDAILVTTGDAASGAAAYLHHVEGVRADIIPLDSQLLGFRWCLDRARRLHPDLAVPEGVYGVGGWTLQQWSVLN